MRASCRHLFVWSFAAFFAGISLLGQGLHQFVEHGHEAAGMLTQREHGTLASHTHDGHCHAHADRQASEAAGMLTQREHGTLGSQREHGTQDCHEDVATVEHGTSHPHDCTICAYFAQAQRTLDIEPVRLEFVSCAVVHAAEQTVVTACVGIYHSRAPPSGAPIC
jgi:hypothetical protein